MLVYRPTAFGQWTTKGFLVQLATRCEPAVAAGKRREYELLRFCEFSLTRRVVHDAEVIEAFVRALLRAASAA